MALKTRWRGQNHLKTSVFWGISMIWLIIESENERWETLEILVLGLVKPSKYVLKSAVP